jgi:uncharacterized protein involved in outer membrane biogenesis
VRKLLKGLLIAAAAVVAAVVIGVLAMNLYVQSAGTQKRIQDGLSKALKAPVHITSTTVTPWGGLKATGITVSQLPPRTGNFLDAASFSAHFDWLALFKHRLDANEVLLDAPRISWFQTGSGKWDLPRQEETPAPKKKAPPKPAASVSIASTTPAAGTPAPAASVAANTPPRPVTPVQPAAKPWQVSVQELAVQGGTFDFWDEKGNRLLQFSGVQFQCMNPSIAGTKGTASAKFITLHDFMFFSDMTTNWSYKEGMISLESFITKVGGGQILGDAQAYPLLKHSPFNADVTFDGIDVDKMLTGAGEPAGEVTGTLKGWLSLNGNSGKTSSLNGGAHLELTGGQLQNIDILQLLGRGLEIPDLIQLNLKTAEADARVANGIIYVDKLVMQSQNLELSGTGKMEIGGKVNINARLTVDGKVAERVPSFILTYFKEGETPDSRYMDFKVDNTMSHPKTDILEKILGNQIQSGLIDLMKSLSSKKSKKEEPESPAP